MSRDPYRLRGRYYTPPHPIRHQSECYDADCCATLRDMEDTHFWYRGRHRFLLGAVQHALAAPGTAPSGRRLIDLGGGCGGWIRYLLASGRLTMQEVALGDSSEIALAHAAEGLPGLALYHLDVSRLGWEERWDIAFLLDVLEHVPDDGETLSEVYRALAPGGLLFVTAPALSLFWTWNDELVGHRRRYARRDLRRLAGEAGFALLDCRYFMFFLSPLLLAARWAARPPKSAVSSEKLRALLRRAHRTPNPLVNGLLAQIFAWETPLGHRLPFPWGCSILAVLQKPAAPPPTRRSPAS